LTTELRIRWHKLLARFARYLVDCRVQWVKNSLIGLFLFVYKPLMEEAEKQNPFSYDSFNAFFSRRLREGARSISAAPWVVPADGILVSHNEIKNGVMRVKGKSYTTAELLDLSTDDTLVSQLTSMTVFYLSPSDYHGVHSPCDATLTKTCFIPGTLFPVNERATRKIPSLYARNQRLAFHCDTNRGSMVLVMVGALFVSSIRTSWGANYLASHNNKKEDICQRLLVKGEEIGFFLMGSSVVLLMEKPIAINPPIGEKVRVGEALFALYND